MSKIKPETDFRKVVAVLRRPEIKAELHCDVLPQIGGNALYLPYGQGYVIYFLDGKLATMHAALVKGDVGKGGKEKLLAQWRYIQSLGISTIKTRHRIGHRRASIICRALGMVLTESADGFKVYEVNLNVCS